MPHDWPFGGTAEKHSTAGWRGLRLGGRRNRPAPDESAAGDFDDEVLSSRAIHPFAHPALAVLGDEAGLIKLRNEIIEIVVGLKNDVAATTAVATAGPAFGHKRFPMKRHGAFAAVP